MVGWRVGKRYTWPKYIHVCLIMKRYAKKDYLQDGVPFLVLVKGPQDAWGESKSATGRRIVLGGNEQRSSKGT